MPALSRLLIALFAALGVAGSMNMVLPEMPHRLYTQLVSGMVITMALYWSAEE